MAAVKKGIIGVKRATSLFSHLIPVTPPGPFPQGPGAFSGINRPPYSSPGRHGLILGIQRGTLAL
jgi:hypothetical protein